MISMQAQKQKSRTLYIYTYAVCVCIYIYIYIYMHIYCAMWFVGLYFPYQALNSGHQCESTKS